MNVDELMTQARDSMKAAVVFAEPIEKNGTTVLPAAKIRGGVGVAAMPSTAEAAALGCRRSRPAPGSSAPTTSAGSPPSM
jgi:uncharacterized spore protein YtfJ